jgi:hypothetical protein
MTPWLLAAIAAILFYRLVERRHKLWVLKGLAVIAVISVLAAIAIYVRGRAYDSKMVHMRESAEVTLVGIVPVVEPHDSSNPLLRYLGVTELHFQVCNKFNEATKTVEFRVAGRNAGHSTEYAIERSPYARLMEGATSFSTDRILSPGECDTLTFYGKFDRYDQYVVRTNQVEYLQQR